MRRTEMIRCGAFVIGQYHALMFIWNVWPQFFRSMRGSRNGYREDVGLSRLHRLILQAELSRGIRNYADAVADVSVSAHRSAGSESSAIRKQLRNAQQGLEPEPARRESD
jgi:hypothetical protein